MEKLKELAKNVLVWVAGAIAVLLGLFFFEKGRRKDAEAALGNAEADKESEILKERKANNDNKIADIQAAADKEKKAVDSESSEELADWFKKRD